MFNGFNQTVIGESHNAANKVCQDWSDHYVNDNYCVAVLLTDMEVKNISEAM